MSNPLTRPSLQEVVALIASTTYTRLPSGKTIVCEITLVNGYTCHGLAHVVDLDNYDEERGKAAALAKATAGVWDVVALLKQVAMHNGHIENKHQEIAATLSGQPQLI